MVAIEIISTEYIKPSSPTPHHLKTHKLSFLDQFIPSIHYPILIFYPQNNHSNPDQRSHQLKQSLSQTLARYYPLAGKIKDNLSVDCNDEGAYYVEARVNNIHLSEFLNQPDMISSLDKLIPSQPNEAKMGVVLIQVNMFDCGGMVIAVYVWHSIIDGISLSNFLKDWAATTQDTGSRKSLVCCPNFDAPSRFPQDVSFPKELKCDAMWIPLLKTGKCATRRFVFDASAIATLKRKAVLHNPTRIELVSALIWKSVADASKQGLGYQKPYLLTHTVNLRPRAVPALSHLLMGNIIWLATGQWAASEVGGDLDHFVANLREMISKVDSDFVNKFKGDGGLYNFRNVVKEMSDAFSSGGAKGAELLMFNSWCNFGLYQIDFGWGKPVWVSSVASSASIFWDFVHLMDTKSGDGIEAWVSLDERDMAILERDLELLTYTSLDPSPLRTL